MQYVWVIASFTVSTIDKIKKGAVLSFSTKFVLGVYPSQPESLFFPFSIIFSTIRQLLLQCLRVEVDLGLLS